jgi:hypothetical protein
LDPITLTTIPAELIQEILEVLFESAVRKVIILSIFGRQSRQANPIWHKKHLYIYQLATNISLVSNLTVHVKKWASPYALRTFDSELARIVGIDRGQGLNPGGHTFRHIAVHALRFSLRRSGADLSGEWVHNVNGPQAFSGKGMVLLR